MRISAYQSTNKIFREEKQAMQKKTVYIFVFALVALSMIVSACAPAATPAPAEPPAVEAPATPTEVPVVEAPAAEEPAEEEPAPEPTVEVEVVEEAGKRILRVGMYREMDTLNPFTSQMLGEVYHQIFEGLTMSNDKNSYFGMLAVEIPTVENGGVITNDDGQIEMTWKLQEGVLWHDGVPVTAEDVCFTYDWIVSEDGNLIYNQGDYKNIEKCEVIDDTTLVLTWKNPFAKYQTLFEAFLPKHLLEGEVISTLEAFNRAPVGNGPYKFEEWKAGEYIRLVKNEDYWRSGLPNFDEMVFYSVPDANTRLNGIKAGEFDIVQLNSLMIKEAEGIPGTTAVMVSQNAFYHLDFSFKSERGAKLFEDIRVRQAIFYGIDRDSIANDLFAGNVVVAHTPIHPTSPYHNADVMKYDYDPDLAAQLLDEAGWVVGSDGIREKDGEKLSFSLITRSDSDRTLLCQAIQALLKPLGVDVKVEAMEALAFTNQWRSGDWEAVLSGWILPGDPSFTRQYACEGSNNMTGTCDEELDELMIASDQELVFDARKELSFAAQQRLAEVAYQLPIFFFTMPFVMDENFVNFKPNGTNMSCFWNAFEWDIAQ
jgi:peptide/nickel transport system substrate-binding protein